MSRIVDLSAPIAPSPDGASPLLQTGVQYVSHAEGAAEIEAMLGGPGRLLRDGEGWTRETLVLGTHNATHVDAPWHYNSTIAGRAAETIDELPLDWFLRPGVALDFDGRGDGDAIAVADLEAALAEAGHELAERDIVLVRTGCDRFLAEPDYMLRGPGVTAEATRWLYERGVRVMGIDAWGWDRPAEPPGAGGAEARRAGDLLGGAPVRSAVCADRAALQSRRAPVDRVHGRVLPAQGRARERSTGARGRDRRVIVRGVLP